MGRVSQAVSSGFRVARRARARCVTTGVALGLTLASWTHAADSKSRISSADVEAAQASFERGRALMAQGRLDEACPLFEQSQRLDAGIGTQFNLASCYEAAGRFASAYTLFLEVAAAAQARGQLQRAKVAKERAGGVEPKLSRLVIEVARQNHGELTLERDGSPVASPEWGLAVPVDPGVHEVRAKGARLVPWVHQILVGASPAVYTVRVPVLTIADGELLPCDPTAGDACAPSPTALGSERPVTTTRQAIGLVALGVGVAGFGVGIGFAIHAYSKNESSEDAGCDGRGCPDQRSLGLRRQAVSAGNWATLGTGLGLAGVGAAALLFWVLPDPDAAPNPTARLQPRLGPDVAGLDVYGRF